MVEVSIIQFRFVSVLYNGLHAYDGNCKEAYQGPNIHFEHTHYLDTVLSQPKVRIGVLTSSTVPDDVPTANVLSL